jgi:hypothetical protein
MDGPARKGGPFAVKRQRLKGHPRGIQLRKELGRVAGESEGDGVRASGPGVQLKSPSRAALVLLSVLSSVASPPSLHSPSGTHPSTGYFFKINHRLSSPPRQHVSTSLRSARSSRVTTVLSTGRSTASLSCPISPLHLPIRKFLPSSLDTFMPSLTRTLDRTITRVIGSLL